MKKIGLLLALLGALAACAVPADEATAALAPGEILYPVVSVRASASEGAAKGDTAGILRWIDQDGKTRCWTLLELSDPVISSDAAGPPDQSTTP